MDIYKFLDDIGAEIASNRAVLVKGTERTVVGRIMGGAMILTAEGEEMLNAREAKDEKPKRKPRTKANLGAREAGALSGDTSTTNTSDEDVGDTLADLE